MSTKTAVDRDRLAVALYDEQFKFSPMRCRACGRYARPYYYFVNIRHPLFARLWQEEKQRRGIPPTVAASDFERLRFEVGLLEEDVCAQLQAYIQEAGKEATGSENDIL